MSRKLIGMGSSTSRSPSRKLSVGLRCWVECGGRVLMGRGRAALLTGIDQTRSISGAARSMGMSYRRAWLLVKSMNDAAGEAIVETAIGGIRGGGASLTPRGREVLAMFERLDSDLRDAAAKSLPELMKNQSPASPPKAGGKGRQVVSPRPRKRR